MKKEYGVSVVIIASQLLRSRSQYHGPCSFQTLHAYDTQPFRSAPLVTELGLGQRDIGRGPESRKVALWELDGEAHFGGHDDKASVPSQQSHDEYQRSSSLFFGFISVLTHKFCGMERFVSHLLKVHGQVEVLVRDVPVRR